MKSTLKLVGIIFLVILILSLFSTEIVSLIPLILVGLLIYFPGEDKHNPRLVRLIPYLWGLSFFESTIILVDYALNLKLFPHELYAVVKVEDALLAFMSSPLLIWMFYKNKHRFKPCLLLMTALSVTMYVKNFYQSSYLIKDFVQLTTDVLFDIVTTTYVYRKFR